MSKPIQITDPVRVTIVQRRWNVVIYIRDSKGKNYAVAQAFWGEK